MRGVLVEDGTVSHTLQSLSRAFSSDGEPEFLDYGSFVAGLRASLETLRISFRRGK